MPRIVEQTEAYEIVRGGAGDARVLITVEHATNRLPEGWSWPEEDRWLVNQHWALDLGIAAIARDVADAVGATAVLSRFSRLLVDPNRRLESSELFRQVADGRFVQLNARLDDAERAERIRRLYRPYHDAIDRVMAGMDGLLVLSMHSFTPVYEGSPPRWMEVGILFDREEALARAVAPIVQGHGLVTALNEPYTGKGGLMYSAQSHADRHGWRALEIEVRQDRAINPGYRDRIAGALAALVQESLARLEDPVPTLTEEVARARGEA